MSSLSLVALLATFLLILIFDLQIQCARLRRRLSALEKPGATRRTFTNDQVLADDPVDRDIQELCDGIPQSETLSGSLFPKSRFRG